MPAVSPDCTRFAVAVDWNESLYYLGSSAARAGAVANTLGVWVCRIGPSIFGLWPGSVGAALRAGEARASSRRMFALIDVVALSAPLDEAMPAGPNLEYENEFTALETDARGKPERQFGETVIKATEPDWGDIRDRCAALLARSRDLRLACLLTRAQTRTEGLAGLANGLALLVRLCETLWPTVHPALESDEPDDAMPRLNVLSVLTDSGALLQDVRAATLVSGRGLGSIPVRTAEVALGILPAPLPSEGADDGGSGGSPQMGLELIAGAIREAHGAGAEDPARAALAAAEALKATVSRQSGTEFDLDPLLRRLRPLAKLFGDVLGAASAAGTAGRTLAAARRDRTTAPAARRRTIAAAVYPATARRVRALSGLPGPLARATTPCAYSSASASISTGTSRPILRRC